MAKTKILIVEDEGIVALDLRTQLRDLGYQIVATVKSGQAAVQQAEQTRPDLVMMDIRLKGEMDGITAVEQIRAQFDVPVVYLTAQWDKPTRERARATGAWPGAEADGEAAGRPWPRR